MRKKRTRLRQSWEHMLDNCKRHNLSKHWETFQEFSTWAQESGYNENLFLIRKNVELDYSPSNCFWGDEVERSSCRKTTHRITYNGKTQSATAWARELGYSHSYFMSRFACDHLSLEEKFKPKPIAYSCGTRKINKLRNCHHTLKRACQDETRLGYSKYGAKGITFCQEWDSFKNFEEWAFNNGYKEGLCLIRKDKTEGFNPDNCYWGTKLELQDSCRNVLKVFDGQKTVHTRDLSKTLKISFVAIRERLETCETKEDLFHVGKRVRY